MPSPAATDTTSLGSASRDAVRALVLKALSLDYTSTSCRDAVQTGNHYQSIDLGDHRTSGFRTARHRFLDQIDFSDRTVLDLGSNLGELTREARIRGAQLADGFEYDPFFVELASLITAYRGLSRVSYFQRDITRDDTYQEEYDVVLAFAVFHYIHGVLPALARITRECVIIETHRLDNNFDRAYVRPLRPHFPHYRLLGESEWGAPLDPQGGRVVAVFAKSREALESVARAAPTGAEAPDARRPRPASATRHGTAVASPEAHSLELMVDARRTGLQKRFFEMFQFDSTDDLVAAVRSTEIDPGLMAKNQDNVALGYSGWMYWFLFLKGYLEYLDGFGAGRRSVYHDYLVRHWERDPAIASLFDDPAAVEEYVTRRFRDADRCRLAAGGGDVSGEIDPIEIFQPDPAAPLRVFELDRERPWFGHRIDGWHRLFAARVFGGGALRATLNWEPPLGPVFGVVERLQLGDGRLLISGWCLDVTGPVTRTELRSEGQVLASEDTLPRPDVAEVFSRLPYAADSGFSIVIDADLAESSSHPLEIVALREGVPLGHLRAYWEPEMYEQRSWPPIDPPQAHYPPPERLALRGIKVMTELHELLRTHLHDAPAGDLVILGDGLRVLGPFLSRFLPGANVTGLHWDAGLLAWCHRTRLPGSYRAMPPRPPTDLPDDGADVVLAYSLLPRYRPEVEAQWLAEIERALRPGGLALVTVCGPVAARVSMSVAIQRSLATDGVASHGDSFPATYQTQEFTMSLLPAGLEILQFAEGAVEERQDALVLRKIDPASD